MIYYWNIRSIVPTEFLIVEFWTEVISTKQHYQK